MLRFDVNCVTNQNADTRQSEGRLHKISFILDEMHIDQLSDIFTIDEFI